MLFIIINTVDLKNILNRLTKYSIFLFQVASDTKRTVEVTQQVKLQQKIKRTFSKLIESETECDDDILVCVENIDGKDISTVDNTVCDFTENKSVQNENDKNISTIDKEACDILLRKNRKVSV